MNTAQGNVRSPAPLGVLVIGRKRPGFDQEWNGVIRTRADVAFAELGFSTVGHDTPVADDQAIAATIARIRAAGCEQLVVLQPSIGNGQLAVTVAQHWPKPIVLWATPERQDIEKVSSCSLVGQHMLASILRGIGHPFELVVGDPDDAACREALRRAITLARAHDIVRSAKIGLIGAQPPGYIAMGADPLAARKQLGTQFAPLSLPQFLDRVRDFDAAAVSKDVELTRAMKLPMASIAETDFDLQSRFYLALRGVIEEEGLDAIALKDWPEISNTLGWPFLALARLTGEGIPIGMEGDADGTLTCLIGQSLGHGAGFITDWLEHDTNSIHFWHPGTAPLSMLDAPRLAPHFNIAKPTCVDGSLRVNVPFTCARLWRRDGRYVMTAFEGLSIPTKRKLSGNTMLMQLDTDVPTLFDELVHAGMPHHPVLFEGRCADALRRLARMLNIDWLRC